MMFLHSRIQTFSAVTSAASSWAHIGRAESIIQMASSNKEFYGVWLKEAEVAVAAHKAGVIKGIWKVAGKPGSGGDS
jgi:hypothetical protein